MLNNDRAIQTYKPIRHTRNSFFPILLSLIIIIVFNKKTNSIYIDVCMCMYTYVCVCIL